MNIIEDWMLNALDKKGNTVVNGDRVKLYGKQAIIDAFAEKGYKVRLVEQNIPGMEFDHDVRRNKYKKRTDYTVEEMV